jgi:rhamnosyltransferase
VSPAEFNHGLTRNLAINHCRGQLVALLVQDAIPASRSWLRELVEPLVNDTEIAGAFSRQQPLHDASRITRWSLAKWVAGRPEPRSVSLDDPARWHELQPMERFLSAAFDNVSSCIRRSVWEQHPFPETPIAEDLAWGKEVLLAGHRLQYVPESVVLHSHERPVFYELSRTYLVHRRLYELFGVRTIPTLPALLRSIPLTLHEHLWVLRHVDGPRPDAAEVARTLGLAVAWPLGQYLGGVAGVRGEDVMTPRGV